ncbi:MAG: pentapeptide repeat-containing protein [Oculatellaceae cyanobacterium bins.114]|nr:pentapeptide repeat-containing protein [Oculatellaceae cyanobacterium bins.114]
MKPDLSRVNLENAVLFGADFSRTNLSNTKFFRSNLSHTNLLDANLNHADLRGANIDNANLCQVSFVKADLSGANLSFANLEDADMSQVKLNEAILTGTKLRNVVLKNASLTLANLIYADFLAADLHHADLRNANLDSADLSQASLIEADLRYTNLNGANLTNAKLNKANLCQAQIIGTKFQGAIITGACIKDWNISAETDLQDVVCEYIFLEWDNDYGEDYYFDRRPHDPDQIFAPGEFTKRYQIVLETVDLFFNDGIDWKAFLNSLNDLQSEYGNEVSIQGIEKKAIGTFLVRLEVPLNIDKESIERQAKEFYQHQLQLQEAQYRQQLQERTIEHQNEIIALHRKHSTERGLKVTHQSIFVTTQAEELGEWDVPGIAVLGHQVEDAPAF